MAVKIVSGLLLAGLACLTTLFAYWNWSLLLKSHEPELSLGASQTLAIVGEGYLTNVLPALFGLMLLSLSLVVLVWKQARVEPSR
jgi:hypothetical protein